MSKFRDKANEIHKAGVEQRGNFKPTGVPQRMYNYWLKNTDSKKGSAIRCGDRKENFCHFWRVVLFWSWTLFLLNKAEDFIGTKVGKIVVTVIFLGALAVIVTTTNSWSALLIGVGLLLAAVALVVGVVLLAHKFWNPKWNDKAGDIAVSIFMFIAASYLAFLLAMAFVSWGWIVALYIVGIVALGTVGFFAINFLIDFIQGRRALREAAEKKRVANMTPKEFDAYVWGDKKPRKKSAFSKVLSGIADFLIFFGQAARVWKWKVCPFVEVDTKR